MSGDENNQLWGELMFYNILAPNIWLRPNNLRKEADAAKALLTVPDGDHLTLLNVYNSYMQSKLVRISLFIS